jgi:hypothetical protein
MNRHLGNKLSKLVPIKKTEPTLNVGEYSLKENVFDPSKSSPPNDFLAKLQERLNIYSTNK